MGSTAEHQALIKKILLEFGSRKNIRLWPNNTGKIAVEKRFIKFGLNGSADIIGIASDGIFISIEVKTGESKQTTAQKRFEAMINNFNGIYFVARSVEDCYAPLNKYCD